MEPDDSPPRNLGALRSSSMPLVPQHQSDITHSQPPSTSIATSYSSQRRSSPVQLSTTQSQHVPPPNPSNFSTGHAQFHSHSDHGPDHSQGPSQPTPPLSFPRSVPRVPPPPLLAPDSRFNTIRDDWTMTDQLLAEINRAAHDRETSPPNMAGIGAGTGAQQPVPIPKGPVIERERDRERVRDKKDSPRDGDVAGTSAPTGSGTGRTGSLRQSSSSSSRVALAQPHQPQNQTPPRTPPHTQASHGQVQRPLPILPDRSQQGTSRSNERDRGSPTYYSPPAGSPSHPRDGSPPFRFDERLPMGAGPTKAKTPDRSLPVQEENEGEEDVTITPTSERERERERQRDRELEREQLKERTRQMDHRLPTPQFSSSPMISPERMGAPSTSSDAELSSTVQGDEFDPGHAYGNGHDGRNSRATHRFAEDGGHPDDESGQLAARRALQQEAEDQEETESYTPRSHHASLPSVASNNTGQSTERVVYTAAQLHFRPRTASSDAGGMGNLDTAMLRDAIEKLQEPYASQQGIHNTSARVQQGQQQYGSPGSPLKASHPHGQHTALPTRVPTTDDIRALVADTRAYEAWQNATNHIRPGAPVPPTPPNATTMSALSYATPSLSPGPLRSTPYPYSYPYQQLLHRSQDPQQILHYMQQQQLQQLQLLGAAGGMQTDSTFSPSSTPYPGYDYNPFLPDHFRRPNGVDEPSMSLRSSPSHMPVSLPMFPANRRLHPKRKSVRRMRGSRELVSKLPPRGESTEPRETSPESSDDEVEDCEFEEFNELAAQLETRQPHENLSSPRTTGEDEGEWVDDDEDGEDDLLHLEYHPNFVVNPDKRRKRWELKWDALVKAVRTNHNLLCRR